MSIEVVFLQEENVGVAGKAVVEHVVSFSNEVAAERLIYKLRDNGYNPYVRRFNVYLNIKDLDDFIAAQLAKQQGFCAMGENLEKDK